MLIRVLGPVAVFDNGQEATLGGPRQRRLLAVLVLGEGRVVSTDAIIEAVWGDGEAPDRAAKTLQSYVSRLRSVIGERAITNSSTGYALDVGALGEIDARNFERELREAQAAQANDRLDIIERAISRWAGQAFGEFADEHWCRPSATRLEELRLVAHETRVQAMLDTGRHVEVVPDLEALTHSHRLRERFRHQLMLALYRSGRQADALRAFQHYRSFLADETGLDPSHELVQLDHKIASSDPSLRFVASGRAARGYVLTEEIGSGAFGTVYRAIQPSVDREVAVKVVRAELANDPAYVRRFEGEARVVARLEHPHIVPLYDFWREPGAAYLVFRLIKGGTVESHRAAGGKWPLARVDRLVREVGSALATAHAANIVHRDVKPANLLCDEAGNYYLSDFGIALDGIDGPRADAFSSAGSPLYASPEQVRDSQATARSDQYALGVVAWELLAGRSPYEASRVTELVKAKLADGVPSLRPHRTDLSDAVVDVLQRATCVYPDDRFGDMHGFLDAWGEAVTRQATATTDGAVRSTGEGGGGLPTTLPGSATVVSTSVANPYKGLRAFDEGDAGQFFGREHDVEELAAAVTANDSVAVVGPSGSGKSSLVRAGLVPRLRTDGLLVTTTIPGAHPFEELAHSLLGVAVGNVARLRERLERPAEVAELLDELLPPATSLVLVVDQFEELWTMVDADERTRYLAVVSAAVAQTGRCRLVTTIRADFYDRPLADPVAGPLFRQTFAVTPLDAARLAMVIAGPAHSAGVRVEPELIATLVAETIAEPAALPLLQFALTELYDHRQSATMTLAAHRRLGGLSGVIHQRAEAVMSSLGTAMEPAARSMFGLLVTPGDTGADTRRRARRAELESVPDAVIDAFGSARLIRFDVDPDDRSSTVELAHESLLHHWPRLRDWLEADRADLHARRTLADAARKWDQGGRIEADLARGLRLDEMAETARRRAESLATHERDFISVAGQRRRAALARRRAAVAALSALTAVALVLAVLAVGAGRRADRSAADARRNAAEARANAAEAETNAAAAAVQATEAATSERAAIQARDESALRRLVADATALASTRREVSLLLAVEAYRRDPNAASESALATALTTQPGVARFVDIGMDGIQLQSSIATGGRTLAVSVDGDQLPPGVVVLDAVSLEPLGVTIPTDALDRIAVSPDGTEIATSGVKGSVRRWNASTGEPIGEVLETAPPLVGPWPIAYLPDGTLLVTSMSTLSVYPPGPSTTPQSIDLPGIAWALATNRDGSHVAISVIAGLGDDNQVWAYDTATWTGASLLTGHREVLYGVALRGDAVLATDLPRQGAAHLFEFDLNGSPRRSIELPALPLALATLADGSALVTFVGSYALIDEQLEISARPSATVGVVTQLGDGRLISTGSGGLLLIDPSERSAVATPVTSGGNELTGHVVGNYDGSVVAVVGEDGYRRYRTDSFQPLGPAVGHNADYRDALYAMSPDGRYLAYTGLGFTELIDAATGSSRWRVPIGDFVRVAFSPDGGTVLTGSRQGAVYALSTVDGTTKWTSEIGRGVPSRLAWGGGGSFATVWATASAEVLVLDSSDGTVVRDNEVGSFALVTPGGDELVVMGTNAEMRVVSMVDATSRVLDGGAGVVDGLISADGTRLIGQGAQGQLRVIDLASGEQIGPALTVTSDFTTEFSWTLVGSSIVVGGPGRSVVAYELDPQRRVSIACDAAGRNLTRGEWDRYLGDIGPYRPTCPGYAT